MDNTEQKRTEESADQLKAQLEQGIAESTADLARTNQTFQVEIDKRTRAE